MNGSTIGQISWRRTSIHMTVIRTQIYIDALHEPGESSKNHRAVNGRVPAATASQNEPVVFNSSMYKYRAVLVFNINHPCDPPDTRPLTISLGV